MLSITVVVGALLLTGTLAVDAESPLFYTLAALSGVVWLAGAALAGPPERAPARRANRTVGEAAAGIAAGAACFLAFIAARPVAAAVPWLEASMDGVLARADAGPMWAIVGTAVLSGVGEEVFFRGALYAALPPNRRFVRAVLIYTVVTVATLQLVLVVAAAVMGTAFTLARRLSGGLTAPILMHATWTTMMLLLLPR